MNATLVRRTEAEIRALSGAGLPACPERVALLPNQSGREPYSAPAAEILTVDVSDRFGSYGLTGVVIFRAPRTRWRWTLSC